MADAPQGPGWWVASDGRWYPPEQHPERGYRLQWEKRPGRPGVLPVGREAGGAAGQPGAAPSPGMSPGPGWWVASDGRSYPPEQHPDEGYRRQWGPDAAGSLPSGVAPGGDGARTAPEPDRPPLLRGMGAGAGPGGAPGAAKPAPSSPVEPPPVAPPVGTPDGSGGFPLPLPASVVAGPGGGAAVPPVPPGPVPPPVSVPPGSGAGAGAGGGSRWWVWVAGCVALVAVLVAAVVVVVSRSGGEAASSGSVVALEAVGDAGVDPFTTAVTVREVASFPGSVSAVASTGSTVASSAAGSPPVVLVGTTPGLYGGSQSDVACDVGQLKAFLVDPVNAGKASAWAAVQGVTPAGIGGFVDGLTPVVLTSDTLVRNHGFANGVATPRPAVLQAGTAVLVDATGAPRVKCSCGNPLLAQESRVDLRGVSAPWYDPARVTQVRAGDQVSSFELINVTNGERFTVPAGSAGLWVAVTASPSSDSGQVLVSTDGTTWQEVHTTSFGLDAVAYGDGTWLAVGGDQALRSKDGRTWTDAGALPLTARAVAYGAGTWVIGGGTDAGAATAVSTDASTWAASSSGLPASGGVSLTTGVSSLAYGAGRWVGVLGTHSCGARCSDAAELITSADGRTWGPTGPAGLDYAEGWVSYGEGQGWLTVTSQYIPPPFPPCPHSNWGSPGCEGTEEVKAVRSADGQSWTSAPVAPGSAAVVGEGYLRELAWAGRWYLVRTVDAGSNAAALLASDDGSTWVPAGTAPAGTTGLAASGPLAPTGAPPPTSAAPPTTATTTPPTTAATTPPTTAPPTTTALPTTPPTTAPPTTAGPGAGFPAYITNHNDGDIVIFRAGPSQSSAQIGTLPNRTKVTAFCVASGGFADAERNGSGTDWMLIEYGGTRGYVFAGFVPTDSADRCP